MTETRGDRNNNPGNLRVNATQWVGEIGDDGEFIIFDSALHGIRALARTLVTYQTKDKCTTVQSIINRWAPPVENDTGSYVNDVCRRTGMLPSSVPSLTSGSTDLQDLVTAIIWHENGACIYSDSLIANACALALS